MATRSGHVRYHALAAGIGRGWALILLLVLTTDVATRAASDPSPASAESGESAASDHRRELRLLLEDARRLERDDRTDAALRLTTRGLALEPDDPRFLRLHARLLEAVGRGDEAAAARARANTLAPHAALPPDAPRPPIAGQAAGTGLVVIVLPTPGSRLAVPTADATPDATFVWDALAERVALRIAIRLPGARVLEPPVAARTSVQSLDAWLDATEAKVAISLRVDRAECLDTIKDGRFGLAFLRVGIAPAAREIRAIRDDETLDAECPTRQVTAVVEEAFALPEFTRALETAAARPAPAARTQDIHVLFPDFGDAIERELIEGRRLLAAGRLEAAHTAFVRATRIDPGHLDARSFRVEVERSIELSEQIANLEGSRRKTGNDDPGDRLRTPVERRVLADRIERERREREDLLANLALLGAAARAPDAATLARLGDDVAPPEDAIGFARARSALARQIPGDDSSATARYTTRVLNGPDGGVLARYYFATDPPGAGPIFEEEDTRGDGSPNRFVAWQDGRRREVWELDRGAERPDVHLVYAEDGAMIERIELLRPGTTSSLRVFVFRDGVLRGDFRDRDEDGEFDERFYFDAGDETR